MNITRILRLVLAVTALSFLTLSMLAADAVAAVVGTPPELNWAALLIPVLTPLLIVGVKFLAPKIPKVWLPVMAPFLGAGLDVVMHFSGLGSGGPVMGAVLGAAGVCLREAVDQVKKATAL